MLLGDTEPREFISIITPAARGSLFMLFHVQWQGVFSDLETVTCSLGDRTEQKLNPNHVLVQR